MVVFLGIGYVMCLDCLIGPETLAEVERAAAEKAWREGFCRGEQSAAREIPQNPDQINPYRRKEQQ